MSELTIYHNPACSKSRETLALLRSRGHEPRIVEYLKTPPTEAELSAIVRKLGIEPLQLVRRNEQVFKDKYAGKTLDDKQWIKAMVANPILIERPIVVRGAAAAIGRPPQNVEALLRRHDP
jgi:arsenate reductase